MRSITTSSKYLLFFTALLTVQSLYLSIRSVAQVPDDLYRVWIQLLTLFIIEGFIVFWTLKAPTNANAEISKRSIQGFIFFGANAALASIEYLWLARDPWLASLQVDQLLLNILPWIIIVCAAAWVLLMVSSTKLQQAIIPKGAVDQVIAYARTPKGEKIILLALFGLGLGLRLININGYPPHFDEYNHIRAAFQLLDGEAVTYNRGFFTVTLPLATSFKLFGISLLSARLPMILLNMLAIAPLYLLGKKIDRLAGYLSVSLFILNPTIAAIGQLTRDYAIVPVLLYGILLSFATLLLVEKPIASNLANLRNALAMGFLTIAMFYILFIDRTSTIQVGLAIYAAFFALLVVLVFKRTRSKTIRLIAIASVFMMISFILSSTSRSVFKFDDDGLLIRFSAIPYNALTRDPYQHWSAFLPGISIIYFVAAGWLLVTSTIELRKEPLRRVIFLIFGSFFATFIYMSFFLYVGKIDLRDRYTVVLYDLFVPVMGILSFYGIDLLRRRLTRHTVIMPALHILILLTLFINYPAIKELATYTGDKELRVTGNNHFNTVEALETLAKYDNTPNLIASENYLTAARLYNVGLDLKNAEGAKKIRGGKITLSDAMSLTPEGWLLLSEDDIYALGLEGSDLTVGDKNLKAMEKFSNAYLWHWETK